jgi:hypothetical protein
MLAMVVNDDAGCLVPRGALALFASMLNWPNNSGHLLRAI